jgi:tRNA-binding protein
MKINWQDFEKVDIRVGTIIKAEDFPEARSPAYILHVDFGSEVGIKKSSAQITNLYTKEQLENKQVLGFYNQDKSVVLAVPDKPVENGARLL